MRPSSRALRSIPTSLSATTLQSSSICPSCLHFLSRTRAPSSRTQFPPQRRHASNSEWIERTRRRIWGTKEGEAMPGPADPYDISAADKLREEKLLDVRLRERQDLGLEVVKERAKWEQEQNYKPATTWDGLEHVGITGQWWEVPAVEGERVVPYMTRPKLTRREDLLCAVHRAVVEVSTLQAAGQELTYSSRSDIPESTELEDLVRQVEIKITEGEKGDKSLTLEYPNDEAKNTILEGMLAVEEDLPEAEYEEDAPLENVYDTEEIAEAQDATEMPAEMAEEAAILAELRRSVQEEEPTPVDTTPSTPLIDESFLALPLKDPEVKFAILKRVTQLTSNLIPDHTLPRITTLSALLTQLLTVADPPPKNVYEILTSSPRQSSTSNFQPLTPLPPTARVPNPVTNLFKGQNVPPLAHLPNVKIHNRKQTSIDRHKEVGRWKVIEEELEKRGLPVTGMRAGGERGVVRIGKKGRKMFF